MRRTALAAVLVVVVLLAVACGGDDDDTAGSVDQAAEAADSSQAVDDTQAVVSTEVDSTDATEVDATEASTGSDDGSIDPCELVTADEAAAVLGAVPGEPTNVHAGGVGACTYRLPDGSGAVQINVEQGDGERFLSDLSGATSTNALVVEGVGDAAVANEIIGQITVVQGDTRFGIFISPVGGGPVDAATLSAMAEVAVGRL